MKRFIAVVALLLVVSLADAQIRATVTTPRGITSGRTYSSWAHDSTGGQIDTMQAIPVDNAIEVYYSIYSLDSASCIVAYQGSFDGVNFGASTTIDSLSTAVAAHKSIALPAAALGLRSVRFVRTVQAFRLGVTSPTLKEKIVTKR